MKQIWIPVGRRLAALAPKAKLAVMIACDALFLPLCLFIAMALREGALFNALNSWPWQVGIGWLTLPALALAGLYNTVVRFMDIRVVANACVVLAAVVLAIYLPLLALDVRSFPRSALLIFWFVALSYVLTSRFVARALVRFSLRRSGRPRRNTVIYGAGEAGAQLARTMQLSREYRAICFLDDRPGLWGRTVGGLRVYAPEDLGQLRLEKEIDQIVVAIPSATAAQRRVLVERLDNAGLPVKSLPGLVDLVDGQASVNDIREIDVVDLLGRDAVAPRPDLFSRNITGKVVMVTGAGGSIGSELCRQIATQRPARLVMVDHSEYGLYSVDQSVGRQAPVLPRTACLGSVMDESLLRSIITREGVQTIYHAAAYKHVPIVENNVQRGVLNNVFGTLAVARVAQACRVETCVLISTDKAVRPTNVMGASKRIAELIFQAAALRPGNGTVFSMVRFGNVLGSSGSVVPLFKEQLAAGGPLTITHPDIIRYFMLIPEAAQLVVQAGAMARGGEVFVLDMGEPVRIADLARSMIHLAGLTERTAQEPHGDIEIRYVGLRPGEKLYEELLIGDNVVPSGHERILCAHERHIAPPLLDKMLDSLLKACQADDEAAMLRQIRNLVPEFRPADEVNREAHATQTSQTSVA